MLSSTCCWHASRCGSSCLRAFWGTVGCNLGRCCWPWLAPLEKTPPGVVICAGCRQNGAPLTDKSMYKLVWTTAFRITGKKLNPHLIRDSVVMHLRGSGASERELEVGGWAGWGGAWVAVWMTGAQGWHRAGAPGARGCVAIRTHANVFADHLPSMLNVGHANAACAAGAGPVHGALD